MLSSPPERPRARHASSHRSSVRRLAGCCAAALLLVAVACVGDRAPASPPPGGGTAGGEAVAGDGIARGGDYYAEPTRPQIHLTPERGAMGEPTGLVYHGGLYHLYYRHNRDAGAPNATHWGHATSTDLVTWAHQPPVLTSEAPGGISGGSVVADPANSAGFGAGALVAVFAEGEAQTLKLAYSSDGGYSFTRSDGALELPVADGAAPRDPRVMRDAASETWVLTVAAGDHVRLFTSPDLKTWTARSRFGEGVAIGDVATGGEAAAAWRRPCLLPLRNALTGDKGHVLLVSVDAGAPAGGSGTAYFTGRFDGERFAPDAGAGGPHWLDYGSDDYAVATWANSPTPDHRALAVGWMGDRAAAETATTDPWRAAMTLPRVLSAVPTDRGPRLRARAVPDLRKYRGRRLNFTRLSDVIPTGLPALTGAWAGKPFELVLDLDNGRVPDIAVVLARERGDTVSFGYDAEREAYFVDRGRAGGAESALGSASRQEAPRKTYVRATTLRAVVDRGSVELFGDDGFTVLTARYYPPGAPTQVYVEGETGINGTFYELEPAVPTPGSVARVRLGLE